jgi:hypothetical protein
MYDDNPDTALPNGLKPQCDLSQLRIEERPVIGCTQDVAELFFAITHFERELMLAGAVDSAGRLVFWEIIAEVAVDHAVCAHANPFRGALEVGAASIFLVHNHPSRSLKPTHEDLELTDAVARAGSLLRIPLSDHVIVSEKGSYSILHPENLLDLGYSVVKPRFKAMRGNQVAMIWSCAKCHAPNSSSALSDIKTVLKGISLPIPCVKCHAPMWIASNSENSGRSTREAGESTVDRRRVWIQNSSAAQK